MLLRLGYTIISCILLTACGGGSSSNSSIPSNSSQQDNTPLSDIIKTAENYSSDELKNATVNLVENRYDGLSSEPNLNISIAQKTFSYLFGNNETETPDVGVELFEYNWNFDGRNSLDVNTVIDCYEGSVEYKGKIDTNLQGKLSLNYNDCFLFENGFSISGSVALNVSKFTTNSADISYYFDNLSWEVNGQLVKLTGYEHITVTNKNDQFIVVSDEQYLLFDIEGKEKLFLNADTEVETDTYNGLVKFDLSGELYIETLGKINFDLNDAPSIPPYLNSGKLNLFTDKSVYFEFSDLYILYAEENNRSDLGAYFGSIDELLHVDASNKTLVALNELSLPPFSGTPNYFYSGELKTGTPIEVSEGFYNDPDTPFEDLEIAYRWYVNDVILTDQTTNILPANLAVYNDKVEVSMTVFDGVNLIESLPLALIIEDTPAEIQITNLPDTVNFGDNVQFEVQLFDPDLGVVENSGVFISGPPGVVIDGNGQVNWDVPSNLLFPYQVYEFKFGITDETGNVDELIVMPIKVESDKGFPIARSGIEVAYNNKSTWVGDFDGDDQNEVLSVAQESVFLLEYNEGIYTQKWAYPFKLPSDGIIRQVLPINVDEDSSLEMLVITQYGVSIINGLDSLASLLLTSEDEIQSAAVKDINNDGIFELAYIYSSNNGTFVNVVSVNTPQESLFNIDVFDAQRVEFANVDNDEPFELILNNGLVYDTATWLNEWFSGNTFGGFSLVTGDFNGDGVDEIAGADRWGDVAVYSAIDKSQLDSLDNFNTCTLHSADVDNDNIDELLVGDCQWGNITVYKLINNALTVFLSIDQQSHGSVSLTSGDSDNDGELELHWGTGISSSGQDFFISADIDDDKILIKEDVNATQLGNYNSAGFAKISDTEERAVFFVPTTNNGYSGGRVVLFDEQGNYELNEETSASSFGNFGSSSVAVTDFNNDGLSDIFLPYGSSYDSSFSVMELYNHSIYWEITNQNYSNIGVIKADDLNSDGYKDAIYTENTVLNAVDIENQSIIANYTFDSAVIDYVSLNIEDEPVLLVSSYNKLTFLVQNGSVFSERSFIEQSCNQVELINYDTDADLELICLDYDLYFDQPKLVIFELNDSTFVETARHVVNEEIFDIAIDPTKTQQQNLFITTNTSGYNSDGRYQDNYQLKNITSHGHVIWSSPNLVGLPSKNSIQARHSASSGLEILLSTNRMMYWVK